MWSIMLEVNFAALILCMGRVYSENFSSNVLNSNRANITELFTCFANITNRYYKNTNYLFISEEVEKIDWFHLLLNYLPGTVEIQNGDNFVGKFGFFTFFPSNNVSYRNILRKILPYTYNRFLVVMLRSLPDFQLQEFVTQFWEFRLLDMVILIKSNESFEIYSYYPYTESNCHSPGPLELLDVWNISGEYFLNNSDLFPLTKKLKNLNGCKLVCFAKTRPPDSIVKEMENHTWKLEGIGGYLLEEIRKRINFTPIIKVPKMNVSVDKYGYDISYGFPELVTEMLNNFTADLAFGIYSHIIYDNPKVEFAMPAVSECYGWAVPAHSGKVIPLWMYYTQEFNITVWILILAVFICSVVSLHYAMKIYIAPRTSYSFDYIFLYILSVHLGFSASSKMKISKLRICVFAIILYSLIISSAYQSSLGSFLTVPWQRDQIKNFQEILSANYNIVGIPQGKRILQRFSADNKVLKTLSQRFQVHRSHFDSVVLRIQQLKDAATFGAQRFIQFYISNELNGTGREEIYLLPKCVIQAHASPFLFKKGSHFTKPIDKIISSAIESGLTNFWFTYSTPKIVRTFSDIFPLSLRQLQCAFALLFIGNCIAFFVFIREIKNKKIVK